MIEHQRTNLTRDFFLPTLLFATLGGMTWAVRGCSGYGAVPGCIFAGVMWGAAWWYLAHDPSREQSRRYASGWIVLALTFGIGLSGARGWMQWPSFFDGKLMTDAGKNQFVAIDRVHGFIWQFVAGVPWAGLGACMLAWCGSLRETRLWHWVLRMGCGFGGAALATYAFREYPQYFLPLYETIESRYRDLEANPTLKRLINDNGAAIYHLGFYLGFLLYEFLRSDWKNVVLILTVGLVNGDGWAFCQNWKWAAKVWPESNFNWWRCWESSGGVSIGVALGIAYFLVNRPMSNDERAIVQTRKIAIGASFEWLLTFLGLTGLLCFVFAFRFGVWGYLDFGVVALFGIAYYLKNRLQNTDESTANIVRALGDPNIERFGIYVGLLVGLGLSIRNGLKGWFNIYKGNESYWDGLLWQYANPTFLALLVAIAAYVLFMPVPRNDNRDPFPHAYGLMWLVLIVQNILAQLVTGLLSNWNEMAFSIYYVLLFATTAVIVAYYRLLKSRPAQPI